MDWDEEYELIKAGKALPSTTTTARAGPSRLPHPARYHTPDPDFPASDEDDDNDVRMAPAAGLADEDEDRRAVDLFPDTEPLATPLEQLTRYWMNERHAPDILPAQEDLLTTLLDHLRRQSDAVQLLRGDPSTSEEEHFRIMLVQTEIERVKFIVRSYVRTRLFKIERYARFIMTNADVQTRLTAAERDHASRHTKITDQHFYLSVLQSLPDKQAHLDDTPIFVPPMITEPDKSRPVFVHALQRCPRIRLPDGATLDMEKGHISLVPYAVVEQLVARREVELV